MVDESVPIIRIGEAGQINISVVADWPNFVHDPVTLNRMWGVSSAENLERNLIPIQTFRSCFHNTFWPVDESSSGPVRVQMRGRIRHAVAACAYAGAIPDIEFVYDGRVSNHDG
jgi:hypothetical protein